MTIEEKLNLLFDAVLSLQDHLLKVQDNVHYIMKNFQIKLEEDKNDERKV